jgi:hypothetical protein
VLKTSSVNLMSYSTAPVAWGRDNLVFVGGIATLWGHSLVYGRYVHGWTLGRRVFHPTPSLGSTF